MANKSSKSVDDREREVLSYWQEHGVFEKSLDKTKGGDPYVFYDGPPFATGLPHHGHLLASTLKDVFPRFFTMKGRFVKRVWGWDCHGLPVENIVEKKLGLSGKNEIEEMGVKKFNDVCRAQVLTFTKEWKEYVDRIGRWVDFDNSYKTMDNEYIESVWWAFKQLYEKDFLYEGEKILMYCPRCATPLAKSEIAMDNSYKTIKDLSVVVKFPLKDYDNTFALAWTTTPWTLPSNLALTVHPEIEYAFVLDKEDGNTYVLAKDLVSNFYKSEDLYDVVKVVKGKELEGVSYEPLFDYFSDTSNAFKILLGDYVTADDGTGVVHSAPAFGEEDNLICRKYSIPMVQPVDENGLFTDEVKDYAGMFIHDANEQIVIDLKKSGKAVMSRKIDHEYPFCYRCDTKLMYRALPAWFVNIQKVKKRLLELNGDINWIPEFLKEGRMKHNLTNAPDWNITRNRYWATAIPLWRSEDGKHLKVLGSIEELKKYAKSLPEGEVDLHKDYLDEVELEIDGVTYKRIPEVLDCWFESGSMPFAQFHYPFENKEFFEQNFPAQFVVEYIAQTRTWFYYMMALSAILFDKIPFENVLTTGTLLAEDGAKLSKSAGNFTDPMDLIKKFGADTFRFYLLQSPVVMAEDTNVSDRIIEEVYKKVTLLLYNVNNFYELYRDSDLGEVELSPVHVMDRWILSETNKVVGQVHDYLDSYNTIKACSTLRRFVDSLSTWYVRVSRDRFASGDLQAKATLKYVLDCLSKLLAPLMPFVAERMYQTVHGSEVSVHLQDWPVVDEGFVSDDLSVQMDEARAVVSLGLRQRDKAGVSLKWPLAKAVVHRSESGSSEVLDEIVKEQLNVKELVWSQGSEDDEAKGMEVELDTEVTPLLEAEGFAREITRKVQEERKHQNLVKHDSISLVLHAEFVNEHFLQFKDDIAKKVGAQEFVVDNNFDAVATDDQFFKSGNIKNSKFSFSLKKS